MLTGEGIFLLSKPYKVGPGKPPKHTQFKKGNPGGPGRPKGFLAPSLKRLTQEEFSEIADMVIRGEIEDLEVIAKDKKRSALIVLTANALVGAWKRKEFYTVNQILDRIVGRTAIVFKESLGSTQPETSQVKPRTFEEFCAKAEYPKPFPKQLEMRLFGMTKGPPRLLLGARGYGKTDYTTVMGVAYEIYLDYLTGVPRDTTLIMTKDAERNAAMIEEIRKACELNGVQFEKANASCIRVKGLHGKDHSVSTVTVGTSSLRGRHPKRIIMDDPVTEDDVSEATRKRVQRKYNELCKLCMNILVIGQPVHKADLYQSLRGILKKLEVPHGSIPELDADLEAMKLAGISPESISASYHLKVISETGFPLENVKLIDAYPVGDSFAFIDPAFGSSSGGDYTALTVLRGHFDGVAVQGHAWRKAWNHCLDEIIKALVGLGVKRLGFETNSLGDMPLDILRQALGPYGIGVVGKCSTNSKHSRIMNAGAYAPAIHLSKQSDRVYIEQVVNYEYGAKNDDAPDSLASCLEMVGLIRGAKQ